MKNVLETIYREPFIHVIDGFYDDLSWLCEYLEKAQFTRSSGGNYAGLFSPPPLNRNVGITKINELMSHSFHFLGSDGEVRGLLPKHIGEEKTFVHVDDHAFVSIVVYLSDAPLGTDPENLGTQFYFHKDLKQKMILPTSPIKYKFQKNILLRDSKDLTKWERWKSVPLKKNRAVIFNSLLYHSSPNESFGSDVFSSRLTQHFFGRILPGELKSSWSK